MSHARRMVGAMASTHHGLPPGMPAAAPVLHGRHLRYALLELLGAASRPLSVRELASGVERLGFRVHGRDGKAISDALRWERARGRVVRTARDRYVAGVIPRSTAHRARTTLRRVHNGTVRGDGSDARSGRRR